MSSLLNPSSKGITPHLPFPQRGNIREVTVSLPPRLTWKQEKLVKQLQEEGTLFHQVVRTSPKGKQYYWLVIIDKKVLLLT